MSSIKRWMLDICEDHVSNSKAINIGWWIAVTLIVLLIYRRLVIDLPFIIIGFVVCIIYLFSFAADNGAEIDPAPIYLILGWIIFISIVYILLHHVEYGSLITVFVGMISLIVIICLMPTLSEWYPVAIVILAIILALLTLSIYGTATPYSITAAILMTVITLILMIDNYVKEALLVVVIMGTLIGLGPAYA